MKFEDLPQPEFEGKVHPDELQSDGANPNSMTPDMFEHLCDRISKRGWIGNAIIVDQENIIADGEHRWRAATELGLEEVPIKRFELTEPERKAIRQEMNKIHGEHDRDKDALEFEKIVGSEEQTDIEQLLSARDESLDWYMEDSDDWEAEDDDVDVAFGKECPECGHEWYE